MNLAGFIKSLFQPSATQLSQLNLVFFALVFAAGAVAGSFLSSFLIVTFVWSALQLVTRNVPASEDRDVRLVALLCSGFFFAELLSGLLHFNGWPTAVEIFENLPFLFMLPLFSVLHAERAVARQKIETSCLYGAFAAIVFALFQYLQWGSRAEGGAGNAAIFALLCALIYGVNMLTLMRATLSLNKILATSAALCAALALVLSGTRSMWSLLIIIPVVLYGVYGRLYMTRSGKLALPVFIVFALFAGAFFYQPVKDRIFAGFSDLQQMNEKNYNTSLGQRVVIWTTGLQLINQKPLTGHGPSNVAELMKSHNQSLGHDFYFTHFHNSFINACVRSGLLGVLSLLAILIGVPLILYKRAQDEIGTYGFALLLSIHSTYLISGVVGIMFGHDVMDTVFVACSVSSLFLIIKSRPRQA